MGIHQCVNGKLIEINDHTTLFDYIIYIIMFIVLNFIHKHTSVVKINTDYELQPEIFDIDSFMNTINVPDERKRLIQLGCDMVRPITIS
jgi:hypothetical protein